jgi:hypothetical protein
VDIMMVVLVDTIWGCKGWDVGLDRDGLPEPESATGTVTDTDTDTDTDTAHDPAQILL